MIEQLRYWYEADNTDAHRFRYALLIFDITTVIFVVASSFLRETRWIEALDVFFGAAILLDFAARLLITRDKLKCVLQLATWADIVAIVSFLAPLAGEAGGFLRILRTLRLLQTYQVLARLRADSPWFQRNEELALAIAHLLVFLLVMTGIVYETQHWNNPEIRNYVDALYFTVTALTTTGFGDITLHGSSGRFISVIIMIFGVTLFLRLLRSLIQPHKVRFACPSCGLQRHDADAVHCKACGQVLNIPDEGSVL